MSGADLAAANLHEAQLRGARLHQANLYKADLRRADLRGVDLRGGNLCAADIRDADLRDLDLSPAEYKVLLDRWMRRRGREALKTLLQRYGSLGSTKATDQVSCLKRQADSELLQAAIRVAKNRVLYDFQDRYDKELGRFGIAITLARLGALARFAELATREQISDGGFDQFHEDLSRVAADVIGSSAPDSRNATMGDGTTFGDNDLSTVKGLNTVMHVGPSIVDIGTIYRSRGRIPEAFLRGAGVPEDFVVYMQSLAASAIEFYSCFISYSSSDDEFARRLHADLQQNGVRCWFAPEDLKIGDKFRTRIDESIRFYDKLMVILTENSIRSPWVEEEVEAALERERKQSGKLVLFPIRLDNAVMDTDQAWAASLRRTRHIGDFSDWKHHEAFKKAFERLLRDLRAGEGG